MIYFRYPHLPLITAEPLAHECADLSIEELVERSRTSHETVQFAPTGGSRISEKELAKLQEMVRGCAAEYQYPQNVADKLSRQFDVQCSILLHQSMNLNPSEASRLEMWAFLCCVLLPDVVRWRFPNEGADLMKRYIGSDRGLRRNTFGRLWWRAYLLHQPLWEKPYELLNWLVEDDLVQMTERNSIASNPVLVSAFAVGFLKTLQQNRNIPRRLLMREAIKRVRRLLSILSFETLEAATVQGMIDDIFRSTVISLKTQAAK